MYFSAHYKNENAEDMLINPQDVIFIKEGLYWSALIFAPLWALRHRMWYALIAYAILFISATTLDMTLGTNGNVAANIMILVHLVFFIFSANLLQMELKRKGFAEIATVIGKNIEEAEYRFFDKIIQHLKTHPQQTQTQKKSENIIKQNENEDIIANPGA